MNTIVRLFFKLEKTKRGGVTQCRGRQRTWRSNTADEHAEQRSLSRGPSDVCQVFKMRNDFDAAIPILGIYTKGNKRRFRDQFGGLQMGTNSLLLLLSRSRAHFPPLWIWTALWLSWLRGRAETVLWGSGPGLERIGSFCFIPGGSHVPFRFNYSETTMLGGSQSLSQAKAEVQSTEAPNLQLDEQSLWILPVQLRCCWVTTGCCPVESSSAEIPDPRTTRSYTSLF